MNELPMQLKCKHFDVKGKLVSETSIDSPYAKIELSGKDVAKVSIEGAAEIFEIIAESE